jgi:hypothetical protein
MALSDIIPWRDRRDELARPGEPVSTLQTQINRLFDDFFDGSRWPVQRGAIFALQLVAG